MYAMVVMIWQFLSVNVGNTAIITDKNLIIVVMVDIEYSMDIYMSLNNNIGEVMKNTEKLKFASDHLKLRKICKHPIKEWSYLIR